MAVRELLPSLIHSDFCVLHKNNIHKHHLPACNNFGDLEHKADLNLKKCIKCFLSAQSSALTQLTRYLGHCNWFHERMFWEKDVSGRKCLRGTLVTVTSLEPLAGVE